MFSVVLLFIAVFFSISKIETKSNYYRPLITLNEDINNVKVDPVTNLPVSYYTQGQYNAETDNTQYFVIHQCSQSTALYKYAVLNIIAPDNAIFNISEAYVVMELSKCKDNWDPSTCFIGSNYIWSNHPTIYTNITWIFVNQPQDIYVRYRSYNRDISITLLLTYTNYANGENIGAYTSGVIPGTIAPSNTDYQYLLQYVKSTKTSTVYTNDRQVFYFEICSTYIPYNADYNLIITVFADIISPLSAFDLIGCAKSNTPDSLDCTTANLDAVTDQDAAPLVQIEMNNDESTDLTQGVWLVVTGQGGNPNGKNVFLIDVTVSKS